MRYQDFVVQIGYLPGGQLKARVLRSPAGEGETQQEMPSELADLASWYAGHGAQRGFEEPFRDVALRRRAPEDGRDVGSKLHDLLFSGIVGRLWEQSLGSLSGQGEEGLRLRLQFDLSDGGELGSLPWELLYRGDSASFLGLDRRTPVLRHLEVAQPVQPQALPAGLKVLGVASAPGELAALDLATEKQNLEGSKKKARRWQVRFLARPTVEELRQTLVEEGSHVLHFMGHGGFDSQLGEGVLYFEDGAGHASAWTGASLAAKLGGVSTLRLVVLNACETASSGGSGDPYRGVAAALVRGGVPAVVAMQRPISDAAAIAFSSAFYRYLASGAKLEEALTEARQAIHTLAPESSEWSIPVLFGRTAERDIFSVPDTGGARRTLQVVLALGLVLGLLLAYSAVRSSSDSHGYRSEIEQILATGVDGLEAHVVMVEILEDGRIRLHISVDNKSPNLRRVGLDFAQSYLADEFGNAYEVKASSSPIPGTSSLIESVPAGESRKYWVEVSAPQDGARRLHVELAVPERSEATFAPFEVALPSYPRELSVPSPKPERLEDAEALPFEVAIDSGRLDVVSQVRQLEVAEKGMRLSFDMWNRGTEALAADFDPSAIVLRDALGNVLKPTRLGFFEGGKPMDLPGNAMMRRAVRTRYFVDFPPPRVISKRFELQLATISNKEFAFTQVALSVADAVFERVRKSIEEFARKATPNMKIEKKVAPPPPTPEPAEENEPEPVAPPVIAESRFEVAPGEQVLKTSCDQLEAKVGAMERLSNGRLRILFTVTNSGTAPFPVPLRLDGTKLADDRGRQYRLVASTFGEVGEGGPGAVTFTLGPGGTRELSFEFSVGARGAEEFTFILGSADPDRCRFLPMRTQLPES